MRSHPGRLAAATLAIVLASGNALAGAAPAFAVSYDVYSVPVIWEGVEDIAGGIGDARFSYPGLETLPGWTSDAFDGIGRTSVADCTGATGSVILNFVETSPAVIVTGGTSVFRLTSTGNIDPANCEPYEVNLILTIQGSFARWDYTFSGDFERFEFTAGLGSDADGVYTDINPSTVLVSDSSKFSPSVIVYGDTSGTGSWVRMSNNVDLTYFAEGSPVSATFVTAVADYTWITGQADADAYLTSIASTLATTSFGTALPLFHGSDAPDFAAKSFAAGAAVNTVATYSFDPGLMRGLNYFDNIATGHTVQARLGTLPTGLTGTVTYAPTTGAPIITLSGTATVTGTFNVPVTFFLLETDNTVAKPLFTSLPITVSAAAGGSGGAGGIVSGLADTGTQGAELLIGAAGLIMGGLALVYLRRRTLLS